MDTVRSSLGFVGFRYGFHGCCISLLARVPCSHSGIWGFSSQSRPLTVRSKVNQVSVFSMSCVVDVVAELEILDHPESLKQMPDGSVGNETKAGVIGVGVLARVVQHDDALGAE